MKLAEPSAPGAIRLAGWRTPERVSHQIDTRRPRWPGPDTDDGSYRRSPGRRVRPVQDHQGAAAPPASPPRRGPADGNGDVLDEQVL